LRQPKDQIPQLVQLGRRLGSGRRGTRSWLQNQTCLCLSPRLLVFLEVAPSTNSDYIDIRKTGPGELREEGNRSLEGVDGTERIRHERRFCLRGVVCDVETGESRAAARSRVSAPWTQRNAQRSGPYPRNLRSSRKLPPLQPCRHAEGGWALQWDKEESSKKKVGVEQRKSKPTFSRTGGEQELSETAVVSVSSDESRKLPSAVATVTSTTKVYDTLHSCCRI